MNRYAGPSLVLSVLGARTEEIADRASVRVEGRDLTIGRAEQCDWVLHAHGVSRQHALVRYLNGLYFLEDRSTNGMLLNGAPLRGGEPALLGDGDLVQIDTFEVLVAIESPVEHVARTTARRETRDVTDTAPAASPLPAVADAVEVPAAAGSLVPGEGGAPASLDPLAWFQTVLPTASPASPWNHVSPLDEHLVVARVDNEAMRRPPAVLPENWDRTRSLFRADSPVPVDAPVEAQRPPAPVSPPDAVPGAVEPLFLLVLEGVMDVLRARAELKNGFRMPATLIRRTENNPLKFAPTATEAMARLLASPNEAFLSGEAAIVDAMDDIRLHQVALLSGVRAAFDDLIAQFDPARFDEEGARRPRFMPGAGKGAWERYRAHYQGLAADPEERFRRLFGDEFARAYEDQLARFKSEGAAR
ncbi:type VI secretion system protein ImpI [Luteibacter jiangsuensis]|uniref:Type VI secretion system protein ImpI n=1 Tax=Luteibacter jiangsuensis TaxID=637577 RepID=A0ABT9T1Z0_9GAMM|nr:type VI secretion system-associated FHA domain protein TagH [Luteibacter jiangsuensis]MDQ0010197.1 type VI secretion system protein ImpI [Luteibacter jiangsuensis]